MPPDDQILVSSSTGEDAAFARVMGRGSFKVSGSLKEFGSAVLEQGKQELVLDLADCVGMDSTFMGVIAGLSFRYKKQEGGKVVMVNLSDKTLRLISTLGLDHLVEYHMREALPDSYRDALSSHEADMNDIGEDPLSEEERSRMMLESHQELSDLSEANRERFKDVLTYLREEVDGSA